MNLFKIALTAALLTATVMVSGCAKTVIDRAIEARSFEDIAKDNEIVIKVNAAMAELETIKASTTIYEQRLLVTGLFDDKAIYERFGKSIRGVAGIRKLYWHAAYLGADVQRKRTDLLSWDEVLVMSTKAQGRLIGTRGVADVNFRVAADTFGTVYLMGRARSKQELDTAIARARDGEGVRKIVNYAFVRP